MKLKVAPLTPDRWPDLEAIFKAKACSVARGCWCMAQRLSGSREPLPPGVTRAHANRDGSSPRDRGRLCLFSGGSSSGGIGRCAREEALAHELTLGKDV